LFFSSFDFILRLISTTRAIEWCFEIISFFSQLAKVFF